MDEAKLKELKAKYGDLYEVEYGDQKFYFRKPTRPEYKRYYDKLLDSIYDASCILILDLVVIPPRDQLGAFIEKDPSFPIKAMGKLTDFFGSTSLSAQKI